MRDNKAYLVFRPEHNPCFLNALVPPSTLVAAMAKTFPRLSAWVNRDDPILHFREPWRSGDKQYFTSRLIIQSFPTLPARRWEITISGLGQDDRMRIRTLLNELGATVGGTTTHELGHLRTLIPDDDRLFASNTIRPSAFSKTLTEILGSGWMLLLYEEVEYHPGTFRLELSKRMYTNYRNVADIQLPTIERECLVSLSCDKVDRQKIKYAIMMALSRNGEVRPANIQEH